MFLHWLNNETGSQRMRERYQQFVQDAHTNCTAEPTPLGHPLPSGATYLFTIYQPDRKTWLQALPFKLFREVPFLPTYIAHYSLEAVVIHRRGSADARDVPIIPILSPAEKSKRSRDDDEQSISMTRSLSLALLNSFFLSGTTPIKEREATGGKWQRTLRSLGET